MTQGELKACASDYQGGLTAEVTSADGERRLPLQEDLPGAGYFSGSLAGAPFDPDEPLTLVVSNLAGETAERALGALFTQPGPRAPLINAVSLDLANSRVYANVESGAPDDPASALEWVRAYHPGLPGGAVELEQVINAFEDPHGFVAALPPEFANTNVEIVAYVADGVFARHMVSETEVQAARKLGSVTLAASIDTTGEDEEWWVNSFDLDEAIVRARFSEADDWSDSWNPPLPADLWLRANESHQAWMFFHAEYARVPASYDFAGLSRDEIDALNPSELAPLQVWSPNDLVTGDILALRTTEGRYAKLRVLGSGHSDDGSTNYYRRWIELEYVTFANPGE
jgi:hypothetical protein